MNVHTRLRVPRYVIILLSVMILLLRSIPDCKVTGSNDASPGMSSSLVVIVTLTICAAFQGTRALFLPASFTWPVYGGKHCLVAGVQQVGGGRRGGDMWQNLSIRRMARLRVIRRKYLMVADRRILVRVYFVWTRSDAAIPGTLILP